MFEIKHFEVLVLERMFRTVEHMQVLEELAAKTVLGEHTFHPPRLYLRNMGRA